MANFKRKDTVYTNDIRDRLRMKQGFWGFFMCLKLFLTHPGTHFVICTFGIGDAILASGYLRAFKKKYNIKHITLVGKERMKYLYELNSDAYDALILREEKDIVCMTNAFLFDPACYLFMRWLKKFTPVPVMFYYRNCLVNHIKSVNMINTFKAVIFGLPQDTSLNIAEPKYVNIDWLVEKHKLPRGKTVIISPAARNTPKIADDFWHSLAQKFHEKGFSLIVNHFDYGHSLPNAINLDSELSIMLALAEYCGHVVSLRSGFCDYCSLTSCQLTVIYPDNWDFAHNVSMKEWGISGRVDEITYSKSESNEQIEAICGSHMNQADAKAVNAETQLPAPSDDEDGGIEDIRFYKDISRIFSAIRGNFKIASLLSKNKSTHYVVLSDNSNEIELACSLLLDFKKAHNIEHLTVVSANGNAPSVIKYKNYFDDIVIVSSKCYASIMNAFRFDYAYYKFHRWNRRITVANAEVFFRVHYKEFKKLASVKDLFEIAILPIRS